MKAAIMEMLVIEQTSIHQIQSRLLLDYLFMTDLAELDFMLMSWGYPIARHRSRPEIEPEHAATDWEKESDDLTFARELQEQTDRETAEALQYSFSIKKRQMKTLTLQRQVQADVQARIRRPLSLKLTLPTIPPLRISLRIRQLRRFRRPEAIVTPLTASITVVVPQTTVAILPYV